MRHYKTTDEMRKLDDRKGKETVEMPILKMPKKVSLFRRMVNILLFKGEDNERTPNNHERSY